MVNYFSSLMPHFCSILLPLQGDDHTLTLTHAHNNVRAQTYQHTHAPKLNFFRVEGQKKADSISFIRNCRNFFVNFTADSRHSPNS